MSTAEVMPCCADSCTVTVHVVQMYCGGTCGASLQHQQRQPSYTMGGLQLSVLCTIASAVHNCLRMLVSTQQLSNVSKVIVHSL